MEPPPSQIAAQVRWVGSVPNPSDMPQRLSAAIHEGRFSAETPPFYLILRVSARIWTDQGAAVAGVSAAAAGAETAGA